MINNAKQYRTDTYISVRVKQSALYRSLANQVIFASDIHCESGDKKQLQQLILQAACTEFID